MSDKDKNKKLVCNVYAAMVAVLCLIFVPIKEIMAVSLIMTIILPIALYFIRGRHNPGSLVENHMSYLIRTFWMGGLILSVGFIIACIWFWHVGDHKYIFDFLDDYMSGVYSIDHGLMITAYESMMINYMNDNISDLIMICSIALIPGISYIIYRIARGLIKAVNGYRIGNINGWL